MTYAKHVSAQNTPQTQPLLGRAAEMAKNQAGGYTFKTDDWTRLRRFLILGCEGGTFYQNERALTVENAEVVLRCLSADGARVIAEILEVSENSLAPKQEPAIFALALASKAGEAVRQAAYKAVPRVCRIGTHLFRFVEYREALSAGWGRGMRRAIGNWYLARRPEALVFQLLKYQQRNGWSHRDLLRLSHPEAPDSKTRRLFDAVCQPTEAPRKRSDNKPANYIGRGWAGLVDEYPLVHGWLELQKRLDTSNSDINALWTVPRIIRDMELPRELVPTQMQNKPEVWEALLPNLGYGALIRNLGNMGKSGFLKPLSQAAIDVCALLVNEAHIHASRIHPWQILIALHTYSGGHSLKGSGTWTPVPQVVAALDDAFELAFKNVVPSGKRLVLGIDVSSSMTTSIQGSPLSAAQGAAAMAMITVRCEPNVYAMGFAHEFRDLKITARDSMNEVLRKTQDENFGGTDCSIPMRWAMANKIDADAFIVYSDNQSWQGQIHAAPALENYRKARGIASKFANVMFTAANANLVDPKDLGSMNFVGLDASLPAALSAFVNEQ